MGLLGLVSVWLWICGLVFWLYYLLNEVKKSRKKLGSLDCQHLSITTEIWLVLAVITNASGWITFWNRFVDFPYSWITTVVAINLYRLLFNVKPTMPIILDLGVSLIVQWILSLGEFGWKWAFLLVCILIGAVFSEGYFRTRFKEFVRIKLEDSDAEPLDKLLLPLPTSRAGTCVFDVYVVNGWLLLVAWFYPWNDGFYRFYQDTVGILLVLESRSFLSCYKYLCSKKEFGFSSPKGDSGKKPSKSLSKKS